MQHRTMLAALGCAAMVLASAARGAEDSSGKSGANLEEARQHAAKAKVHYDLGEFEKAAEEYILVYRLRPLPALLFNIAQSYRQAGQHEKAKQFYKAYLRENPDSQTSAAVKKALKEIDELLAKERKTREAPPSGIRETPSEVASRPSAMPAGTPQAAIATPPPVIVAQAAPATTAAAPQAVPAGPAVLQPRAGAAPSAALPVSSAIAMREAPSSSRRTWTYALAGVSAVMLSGGAIFAMKAKNVDNELLSGPHSTAAADDLLAQSKSAHGVSALFLLAGVASAAGAGVLYFWPTSSGAAVTGRF
jgi:tetratricopeptide (TPR) repeat protein